MNFNGGVIIIGSLLWDDNKGRKAWRQDYLRPKDTKIPVPLKIRYGRESESRNCTYTMIFSNHPTTELGQGYVWGFKENSKIEGMLEKQAIALAKVEGICTDKRP
ncbi:MAG: hypothetical protein U1E51_01365, partial [Candidatus Binatia bacterium]|nr:hypothetical protein [Candidatus Binatia bacterium]